MGVLVEGISVIARRDAIDSKYPGGVSQYAADCPNPTFCADDDLTRVGFTSPYDAQRWVTALQQRGLVFVEDEQAVDVAVVDQVKGPTSRCDWLEFGRHDDGYVVAWLTGKEPGIVATRRAGSPKCR
jgi:hypothetical protein